MPSQIEASSTWHNGHGLWAVDTHNPNCSKGIVDYLGTSSADIYLAQESRVFDADAIKAKQRAAKREGWNLSVVPSLVTESQGVSAGVAIASRAFHGMSSKDLSFVPEPFRSRIDCVHCGVMCKVGVHFLSVYC